MPRPAPTSDRADTDTIAHERHGGDRRRRLLWIALLVVAIGLRVILAQPFLQNSYRTQMDEGYTIKQALAFGTGDLNPRRWAYPTGYTYLLAFSYGVVYAVGHLFGVYADLSHFAAHFFFDPRVFMWSGRAISLIAGVAGIIAIKVIGDRVFGSMAGWIAAFGLALSPLHIELSAGAKPDTLAILFATLALGAMCEIARKPTRGRYIWAGVFIGLGTGTKYWPLALAAVALGLHVYLAIRPPEGQRPPWRWAAFAALAGVAALFVTSPYLFIDAENGLGSFLRRSASFASGAHNYASFREKISPIARVIPIMMLNGGLPFVLAVIGGCALSLKRHSAGRSVVLVSALLMVAIFARATIAPHNYLLPAFPFLWLLAGYATQALSEAVRWPARSGLSAALITVVVLAVPIVQSATEGLRYAQTDTRTLAERVFHEVVEEGSVVFVGFRSIAVRNGPEDELAASRDLTFFDGRPGGLPHRERIWEQYRKYANGPWYQPPERSYVVVAEDIIDLSSSPVFMVPMDERQDTSLADFAAAGVEYIVFSHWTLEQLQGAELPLAHFYEDVQARAHIVGKVTPEDGVVVGPRYVQDGPAIRGVPRKGPAVYIYRVPDSVEDLDLRELRQAASVQERAMEASVAVSRD